MSPAAFRPTAEDWARWSRNMGRIIFGRPDKRRAPTGKPKCRSRAKRLL